MFTKVWIVYSLRKKTKIICYVNYQTVFMTDEIKYFTYVNKYIRKTPF